MERFEGTDTQAVMLKIKDKSKKKALDELATMFDMELPDLIENAINEMIAKYLDPAYDGDYVIMKQKALGHAVEILRIEEILDNSKWGEADLIEQSSKLLQEYENWLGKARKFVRDNDNK